MAKKKRASKRRTVGKEVAYRQVADDLRKRLLDGEWEAKEAMPSLRALADHYHVGVKTIRLALDSLKAQGIIGVHPRRHLYARPAENAWSFTDNLVLEVVAGLLSGPFSRAYGAEMQRGVQLGVADLKASLLIAAHPDLRNRLPEELADLPVRGVVLYGHFRPKALKGYERLNVPVVHMDAPPRRERIHTVTVDNQTSAYEATSRLVAMGHRRIAFMRSISMGSRDVEPDARERQVGFERALRDAKIPAKREAIINTLYSDTPESPSIRRIFASRPAYTAVVVPGTTGAAKVIEGARAVGRTVPRDISVVAFQSTQPEYPQISGVRVDFAELAKQAVLLLKEPKLPIRYLRVPAQWADGETCAPPTGLNA